MTYSPAVLDDLAAIEAERAPDRNRVESRRSCNQISSETAQVSSAETEAASLPPVMMRAVAQLLGFVRCVVSNMTPRCRRARAARS
jgi:hypothetical protein